MNRVLFVSFVCLVMSACTWVALDKGAEDVLVLPPERLTSACESLGKVKVSVLEKVGVLARHDDEVAADLAVLARNHAAKTGGDTAVPLGPVSDGAREFEIYRCTDGSDARADDRGSENNAVEVLPYDDRGGN